MISTGSKKKAKKRAFQKYSKILKNLGILKFVENQLQI